MDIVQSVVSAINGVLNEIIRYIPHLVSGLIILSIGLIIANIAKSLVQRSARIFSINRLLEKAKVADKERTSKAWMTIFSDIVYWFIIFLFLVPAFNAWQISAITSILNRLILFLPNVFVAVIIVFVGLVIGNIAYQAIRTASNTLSERAMNIMANTARYSIIFFAMLMALNQLGISSNLIQILLTGFVAMLAIAGGLGIGLSIGLGGQETVRKTLDEFINQSKLMGAKGGKQKQEGKTQKKK